MSYRANPTDKSQNEIEAASFSSGSPSFTTGVTRINPNGVGMAPYKTVHGVETGSQRMNAGVVVPHDDAPARFVNEQQGKA